MRSPARQPGTSSPAVVHASTPLGPTAPYVLRPLIRDVDLGSAGGDDGGNGDDDRTGGDAGVWITCVEVWEDNIYIGTSAGELLQVVRLPPENPDDPNSEPLFIPATRLRPDVVESRKTGTDPTTTSAAANQGVQKILLLPEISLAVVICNSSLNFYTLPELSPAFAKFKTFTCTWVEKVDQAVFAQEIARATGQSKGSASGGAGGTSVGPSSSPPVPPAPSAQSDPSTVLIVMSLKQKIRRVLLDEDQPRRMGDIEFGGSVAMLCRGRVACVADSNSYALLDLVGSQKIGLFAISPERERRRRREAEEKERAKEREKKRKEKDDDEDGAGGASGAGGNSESLTPRKGPPERTHSRSTSLGVGLSGGRFQFDIPASLRRGMAALPSEGMGRARASSAVAGTRAETPTSGSRESPSLSQPQMKAGLGAPSPVPTSPVPGSAAPSGPTPTTVVTPAPPSAKQAESPRRRTGKEPDPDPDPEPEPEVEQLPLERLEPHIVSPTPTEFLLTTGTARLDRAMGMFVNMDGDATRGTLEFVGYPERLVVDPIERGEGFGGDDEGERGYAVAVVRARMPSTSGGGGNETGDGNGDVGYFLEIQRWDVGPGEESKDRRLYDLTSIGVSPLDRIGVQHVRDSRKMEVPEVAELLTKVPFRLPGGRDDASEEAGGDDDEGEGEGNEGEASASDKRRMAQEKELAARLAFVTSRTVCWAGRSIFWAVQNHHLTRLNARLDEIADRIFENAGASSALSSFGPGAAHSGPGSSHPAHSRSPSAPPPPQHLSILALLRVIPEPARSELDVFTAAFLGQKAALLLFIDLLVHSFGTVEEADVAFSAQDLEKVNAALLAHSVDVRVVLALVPGVREEIRGGKGTRTGRGARGRKGDVGKVWLYAGLKKLLERAFASGLFELDEDRDRDRDGDRDRRRRLHRVLPLIRLYLQSWRQKKGFGSVEDAAEAFAAVDAALLRVLLALEADGRVPGPGGPGPSAGAVSASADLVSLLSDPQFDSVDVAERLLRRDNRLDLLARLYRTKGMHSRVLECWQKMIEMADGEEGADGPARWPFPDGEAQVRAYLGTLMDRSLVQKYAVWLARRSPKLGISVLVSDSARVRFDPHTAVAAIRDGAPAAVRDLLEVLVFSKKMTRYAPELIHLYLDAVLARLACSAESRAVLEATYETYRALSPPKPSYWQFLAENEIPGEWAAARLRLLRLLGGSSGVLAELDRAEVDKIAARLVGTQYGPSLLLPEMVMVHSARREDGPALRVLLSGLGDFAGAVRYCLAGGGVGWRHGGGGGGASGGGGGVVAATKPTRAEQERLFGLLLTEVMAIEEGDEDERVSRAAEVLDRFGAWFQLEQVLPLMPETWPLAPFVGFFVGAVRRLVRDRAETAISLELWTSERLRTRAELVALVDALGPRVETMASSPPGGGGDAGAGGSGSGSGSGSVGGVVSNGAGDGE